MKFPELPDSICFPLEQVTVFKSQVREINVTPITDADDNELLGHRLAFVDKKGQQIVIDLDDDSIITLMLEINRYAQEMSKVE